MRGRGLDILVRVFVILGCPEICEWLGLEMLISQGRDATRGLPNFGHILGINQADRWRLL